MSRELLINNEICCKSVRLSGEKNVITYDEAMQMATSKGLDLIQIAINNDTSICIIEDVNKYIYQQKKKEREASKNKSKTVLKEMKLSLNIGEHDMIHKANKTMEMLQDGCKVKVSLFLAGREINRTNEAINVIKSFIEKCAPCSCDKEPKVEGKVVSAVIFKK